MPLDLNYYDFNLTMTYTRGLATTRTDLFTDYTLYFKKGLFDIGGCELVPFKLLFIKKNVDISGLKPRYESGLYVQS